MIQKPWLLQSNKAFLCNLHSYPPRTVLLELGCAVGYLAVPSIEVLSGFRDSNSWRGILALRWHALRTCFQHASYYVTPQEVLLRRFCSTLSSLPLTMSFWH